MPERPDHPRGADLCWTVSLRFHCCRAWDVPAVVNGHVDPPRVVSIPGADRCPDCGCTGATWDNPLSAQPGVTATSVAEAWGFLHDRFAREARNA